MSCKKCRNEFCWICLKKYTPHHYRIYNCFGCPGMQFEDEEELACRRVLLVIFYLMLPFLLAVALTAVVVTLPIYMLSMLLCRPCKWLEEENEKC